MPKIIDLTGQTFSKLTVIERTERPFDKRAGGVYWLCQCECGTKKAVISTALKSGNTRSCGCLMLESSYVRGPQLKSSAILSKITAIDQACKRHKVSASRVSNLMQYQGATLEKAILIAKAQKAESQKRY